MIYKDFANESLSLLGFGTMRLPTIEGKDSAIDEQRADALIDIAYKGGVNYYDTAWGYHGGQSELFIGKALEKYPRESFNLASKFPGYDLKSFGRHEEIFEKQLEKCRVDFFDFYLLHNLCEMNLDLYLDDDTYHTVSYFVEQKKKGRIRHLGFSEHGSLKVMKRFLEVYGSEMEFCQIQLNYMDWSFQNAKAKVKLLKSYGIAVWVMEPVRGGRLVKLPQDDIDLLKNLRPDESTAAFAFRFVQDIPEVHMILSGMSDENQVKDNLKTFGEYKHLSETEREALFDIARRQIIATAVPCTACHYCVSHCKNKLDIPYLIELYNEHVYTKDFAFFTPEAIKTLTEEKGPGSCAGCRACEAVCPQNIRISAVLKNFARIL